MSQFDLFADPVEPTPPPPNPVQAKRKQPSPQPIKPSIPQPPAIVIEGADVPAHPAGLKPLRVIPNGWKEVVIIEEEFAARRPDFGSDCSDDYVMLAMLEERGIRCKPRECTDMQELYGWVDAPAVMRRRTVSGVAVNVRQAPKEKP